MSDPQIAFIAVRAGPGASDGPFEAVVVGAGDADGLIWRFARFQLDGFERLIGDLLREDSKEATPHPLAEQTADTVEKLKQYGFKETAQTARFGLSDVVRCAFYRRGYDYLDHAAAEARVRMGAPKGLDTQTAATPPLAVFDTCRMRDGSSSWPVEPSAPAPESAWAGSRLTIAPHPTQAGVLQGFEAHLQMRIPLGVHRIHGTSYDEPGDMFDSRGFLALSAAQPTGAPRCLWDTAGAAQSRGALYNDLRLEISSSSWKDDASGADPDRIAIAAKNKDLAWFARKPPAREKPRRIVDEVEGSGLFWPIALIPWAKKSSLNLDYKVARQFGLRAAKWDSGGTEALSLIARHELTVLNDFPGLDGDTDPLLPLNIGMLGEKRRPVGGQPDQSTPLYFAQEQRGSALGWGLAPVSAARWLFTIRTERAQGAGDEIFEAVTDEVREIAKRLGNDLRSVRDARPISVAPQIKDADRDWPWHAVGFLVDHRPHERMLFSPEEWEEDEGDRIEHVKPRLAREFSIQLKTFEPVPVKDPWHPPKTGVVCEAEATLPRLRFAEDPAQLKYKVRLSNYLRVGAEAATRAPSTVHPLHQSALADILDVEDAPIGSVFGLSLSLPSAQQADIGALRFGFTAGEPQEGQAEDWQGMVHLRRLTDKEDEDDPRLAYALDTMVLLPVDAVAPAGQDDPIEDDRITALERIEGLRDRSGADPDAPLFMAMGDPGSGREGDGKEEDVEEAQASYKFAARETVTRGENHTLTLALQATRKERTEGPRSAGARQVLVIDPSPFRVALVEYTEPAKAATFESNEVAVWNAAGEGGLSWRLADEAQTVRVALPTQVIGEAMEKNPQDWPGLPSDVVPDKPAAARFGGVTRLDFDPTYFDTRYREPGWNLSRILGFAGQRAPGARLRDLRMELIYGMTTRVTPRDPVFVTEVSGAIGVPALPLKEAAGADGSRYADYLRLANRIIRIERSRLAVEKLWRDAPDDLLKLESGVSMELRRKTGDDRHGPLTELRWPAPGAIPKIAPQEVAKTFSVSGKDHESFAGGVAWAFESSNILMSVYGAPRSEGGSVQGIHLSAHGGYGAQRGLFDEKKTTVETETTQGRVQRYVLERIGRIGGLWHRAKHVIVYERTVVPSPQFYNVEPIGKGQDEHKGRPLLRKVEEYVELLERVRRYPEDGSSVAAAGCLVGAEFPLPARIRVDSRWGADVRREGWKVPLWNKAFADLPVVPANNPDTPALIYPKPQIRLIMAAEGGGDVAVEVDEPEKLVFYTSVVRGESGDDTDSWRPVRDIDFLDLPPPAAAKVKPRSEDLTDAILPPEPAHVAGYEALTIGLVAGADRVAIAHGRAAAGPAAVLRNITLARARPAASRVDSAPVEAAGAMAQKVADLRAELDRAVGQVLASLQRPELSDLKVDNLRKRAKKAVNDALDRVKTPASIAKLKKEAERLQSLPVTGACKRLGAAVDTQLEAQALRLEKALELLTDEVRRRLLDELAGAGKTVDDHVVFVKAATDDTWQSLLDAFLQPVEAWIAELSRARGEVVTARTSYRVSLNGVAAELGGTIDKAESQLLAAFTLFLGELEAVEGKVRNEPDWEKAVRAARDLLVGQRTKLQPHLQNPSPAARPFALLLAKLLPAAEAALAKVTAGAVANRVALANAIKAAREAIDGSDALKSVRDRVKTLRDDLGNLENDFNAFLQQLLTPLARAAENATLGTFDAALEAAGALRTELRRLKTISKPTVWTELDNAAVAIKAKFAAAKKAIDVASEKAARAGKDVLVNIEARVRTLKQALEAQCQMLEQAYIESGVTQAARWVDQNLEFERYREELRTEAHAVIDAIADDAEDALDEIQRQTTARAAEIAKAWENRAQQFAAAAQEKVRETFGVDPVGLGDKAERLYQQGAQTLQTLRALSEGPKTDVSQVLNRPVVALVYSELNKVVDMSPAIALANRAGDLARGVEQVNELLQSFGVRSPISQIGDELIPDELRGLSIANLIPDIGGIDFRGLLQRAQFPNLNPGKAVNLRHGFDKAELRAWLEADIDIPFAESTTLLEFGPVQIVIDEARFFAQARVSVGKDGTKHVMKGLIGGDWRVLAAGQTVLTFRQTGLFFDESGKLDFRTSPEKVEVAEVLRFITDLMAKSGQGEGLKIGPLMKGSIPTGVAATLDLKLPNLQTGVFGISDLWLHVLFGVSAVPEFELICDLSVGSRMAPFTLNVWILNGGGYITQRLSFLPAARPKPVMTYTLDMAIAAGVGLGFSFGVVSGGVWLQVGCGVAITWTTAEGGGSTAIRVFILARGNVDVAGIITCSIALLLEVSYDGDLMLGAGTLSISVKISMFYTLNVNQRVEYVFAGKKKQQQSGSYSEAYE